MLKLKLKISFAFIVCCLFLASCKKDADISGGGALSFSQDSVFFDTVFTTVGSATKYFRVINNNNKKINISSLRLARGQSSYYRLNVDGTPGKSFTDLEIAAGDSMYVFVEVTIDPSNLNNPFIYEDSILFETSDGIQDVDLISYGWNAYYHSPSTVIYFGNGGSFSYGILPCNDVWLSDKPHVVYGFAAVDSLCTLTINAGCKIYFHANSGIWVYRFGTIKVNGTQADPVVMQGDRLEPEYKDIAGQWDRIWINEGSTGNVINYAIIKNGFIGVQADLLGEGSNPIDLNTPRKTKITNTQILNMSRSALFGVAPHFECSNLVLGNCGTRLIETYLGGQQSYRNCTMANYWNAESRATESIYMNNLNGTQTIPFDSLYFVNCIIDGANAEEFKIDTASTSIATSTSGYMAFQNCMFKTGVNTNAGRFVGCLKNQPTSFVNTTLYDFKLNSNSAAINTGVSGYPGFVPFDIENYSRTNDVAPDIGAYEWH